jgi:hypothetical protein
MYTKLHTRRLLNDPGRERAFADFAGGAGPHRDSAGMESGN